MTLKQVTDLELRITHAAGVASIKMEDLPRELREKVRYDAEAYDEAMEKHRKSGPSCRAGSQRCAGRKPAACRRKESLRHCQGNTDEHKKKVELAKTPRADYLPGDKGGAMGTRNPGGAE